MYDRTSSTETLDEARLHIFAQKGKRIETIPPTEAVLLQHTRRATCIYQGALIWGNALEPKPDFPSPADFWWIKNNDQLRPCFPKQPLLAKSVYTASARCAVVGSVSASKVYCHPQLYVLAVEIVPKYLVKLAKSRCQKIRKHYGGLHLKRWLVTQVRRRSSQQTRPSTMKPAVEVFPYVSRSKMLK